MARLLKHTGTTHRWVMVVIERGARERVDHRTVELGLPDAPSDYPAWLEEGAARLVRTLSPLDPDAPVWTWGADQHVRFWPRRMAHETAMHRWDGEHAAGVAAPIDADLAVDGIQERFDNLAYMPFREPFTGGGDTVHLHCTDRDGEWLVRIEPDGVRVTREHAKGDVAARGSASDLLLVLQGRLPPGAVEVFGDVALLERWQREVRF